MQTVLIVIHLMVVLALVVVVLLQRSEGGGLGIGGSSGGFMTGRGQANLLTRATAILAGVFFLTSLLLTILAGYQGRPTSVFGPTTPASAPISGTPTPATPGAPAVPKPQGSILDQLSKPAPAQPAAPTGPQVPQSN